MPEDPHAVLGVAPDASPQQVTEAYRALAQIYHPDRYAEASVRVQQEAQRRMQELNAAYEVIGRAAATSPPPRQPPPRPDTGARPSPPPRQREQRKPRRPPTQPLQAVLYVDGSKHHHDQEVAPLGLDLHADPVRAAPDGRRCATLDGELSRWFQRQTHNASMSDQLMFAAWDEGQRAIYTASVGCSEVLRESVEEFTSACRECCRR